MREIKKKIENAQNIFNAMNDLYRLFKILWQRVCVHRQNARMRTGKH